MSTRKDTAIAPTGINAAEQFGESGLDLALSWCKFCNLSARATAKKLHLAVSTTQRYMKTPEFLQFYANNKTQLLSVEIFVRTFLDLKYGIGTAMAWLLGGALIVFTAYQLRMLSRAEFRAAG